MCSNTSLAVAAGWRRPALSAGSRYARRLHADLQDQGVRCWFAPHDLMPGDWFREKIDQAIQMPDKLGNTHQGEASKYVLMFISLSHCSFDGSANCYNRMADFLITIGAI